MEEKNKKRDWIIIGSILGGFIGVSLIWKYREKIKEYLLKSPSLQFNNFQQRDFQFPKIEMVIEEDFRKKKGELLEKSLNLFQSFETSIGMPSLFSSYYQPSFSISLHHLKLQEKWLNILKPPFRCIILGGMGNGKTALGHFLLEAFHYSKSVYILGFPADKIKLLPTWINVVDSIDKLPPDCVCLIDESYLQFSSKEHWNDKKLIETLSLARQRENSLIFISQQARLIDINIIALCDTIIVKEPSLILDVYERRELSKIMKKASEEFNKIKEDRRNFSYVVTKTFEGMIENDLPSYWSEEISKSYSSSFISGERKFVDMTKEEKKKMAKEMYCAVKSYKKVAKIFGVSKTTIINWVKHQR